MELAPTTPLATITYVHAATKDPFPARTAFMANPFGADEPLMRPLRTKDLGAAITAARVMSLGSIGRTMPSGVVTLAPAVALLQAADGAYMATFLADDPLRARETSMQFSADATAPELATIVRQHDALRAVVGESAHVWWDDAGVQRHVRV